MKKQRLGLLDYNRILISLKYHREHLEQALRLTSENTPAYSHCEKELNAINELFENPENLKIYVNTWNEALTTIYDVKDAVEDYGQSVSGLFNLEYIGIL